jgi:hypothetical protein
MIRGTCAAIAMVVLVMACCRTTAQAGPPSLYDESDDNPRGNVHLGAPMVIPLNPTARAVHFGYGLSVGGGYNLTREHGLVGDFLWNSLLPTNEALAALRLALSDPTIDMNVGLVGLTGNYRYELRGKHLGAYFLGGAGVYYRHTHLSKTVTTSQPIVCTPIWLWWGFNCTSGTVTQNQTVASWSATAPGYNGGIGFTARVGEPPYRFYVESRYHYVPNQRINTQLIDITFGIRY